MFIFAVDMPHIAMVAEGVVVRRIINLQDVGNDVVLQQRENDVIHVRLNMSMDITTTAFYATYGLTDLLDVSFVVPLVSTHLHGTSDANIIPFGGTSAVHFFAGTPSNPVLNASRDVSGSAFGVGDVAVRTKLLVRQTPRAALALVGDARFATGDASDLLGAGYFSARGMAALSGCPPPLARPPGPPPPPARRTRRRARVPPRPKRHARRDLGAARRGRIGR